jgi:hypothetical protein
MAGWYCPVGGVELGVDLWENFIINSQRKHMKSVYLLLGESNAKKSSTVRCLLGIGQHATEVEVQCVSDMRIHIRSLISAAQEQPLSRLERCFTEVVRWLSELEDKMRQMYG